MTKKSRPTPGPQRSWVIGLSRTADSRGDSGRQSSSWSRALVQATESSAKETIRTSDAPQAKSQAGTGRSLRPTRA